MITERVNRTRCKRVRAGFLYSNNTGTCGSVNFTDESYSMFEILTWQWDFGDSSTSTEQNPQHLYAESGTYNVTLTIYDAASFSATTVQAIDVVCTATNAELDFSIIKTNPTDHNDTEYTFTATSNTEVARYDWHDLSSLNHQIVTSNISGSSSITVSLTASYNDGSDKTVKKTIYTCGYMKP